MKAVAGSLANFSGRIREAYTLGLRQFIICGTEHHLGLFDVSRIHIELHARQLEDLGRVPAIIGRRLSTLAGLLTGGGRPLGGSKH